MKCSFSFRGETKMFIQSFAGCKEKLGLLNAVNGVLSHRCLFVATKRVAMIRLEETPIDFLLI